LNSVVPYSLPAISDPEGDPFTVTIVEQGTSALPAFITITSTSPYTLRIAPVAFADFGSHNISVTIADQCHSTPTSFIVTVTNSAPAFISAPAT
jgi:hypothetical protein